MRWLYRHSKSGSQSTFLTSECPGSSRPTRPVRVSHHPPPARPSTTTPCYGPADFSDTQPALDPCQPPPLRATLGAIRGGPRRSWTDTGGNGSPPLNHLWTDMDAHGQGLEIYGSGRRLRLQRSATSTHSTVRTACACLARCPTMSISSAQLSPGGELDRHRECDRVGWGAVLVELLFQGITDSQAGLLRLAV